MKKQIFIIVTAAVFIAEIVALIVFGVSSHDITQDTVTVNEVMHSVAQDFYSLDGHENATALDYVVLDKDGGVLYKTKPGLSETINAAIAHRDTILDIEVDGETVGKAIIYNDGAHTLQEQKQTVIVVLAAAIAIECVVCVCFAVYLFATVVKPFRKLKGFTERVACGNLDIPLEMDRQNLFGAFTESFDIMRSELKKARLAEAEAQRSKKELVAKLSHDIKTPVASLKAISEVGLAVTASEKDRANYTQIISKADQINSLVTNLFSATLEELEQLTVSPVYIDGEAVKTMLENADYLRRATIPEIPKCAVFADGLRLQQVFDNLFANAYKYADTEISVAAEKNDMLRIVIEDCGGGVPNDELPVLKEKFKRGSNAENIEGAGLGLYISDYFMNGMSGALDIENGEHGLKATVSLELKRIKV